MDPDELGSRTPLGTVEMIAIVLLGAAAVAALLQPGQWLVEESGLPLVVSVLIIAAVELFSALGIAAIVLRYRGR